MKINWGTGIVISFGLFIAFILYFVVKVQTNPKYDNEMVVEKYYQKDALYSQEMQKEQNAKDLEENLKITPQAEGVVVEFPSQFDYTKIKGKVSLYRPSNKKLDFEQQISLSNQTLLIPKKSFVGGRWDITVEWTYDTKTYLVHKQLTL